MSEDVVMEGDQETVHDVIRSVWETVLGWEIERVSPA
jgi:hypothetical protein